MVRVQKSVMCAENRAICEKKKSRVYKLLKACRTVLGIQRAVMSVCEKKSVKGAKRSIMSLNKIVFGIEKGYEYKKIVS